MPREWPRRAFVMAAAGTSTLLAGCSTLGWSDASDDADQPPSTPDSTTTYQGPAATATETATESEATTTPLPENRTVTNTTVTPTETFTFTATDTPSSGGGGAGGGSGSGSDSSTPPPTERPSPLDLTLETKTATLVEGELTNVSNETLALMRLTIRFYDGDEEVQFNEFSWHNASPGEYIPFEVRYHKSSEDDPEPDRTEVQTYYEYRE